jgi:hypothetical protein
MTEIALEKRNRIRCARGLAATIERGIAAYRRETHLPRLLPIACSELTNKSDNSTQKLCLRLATALRQERVRGRAGHWSYDVNRHLALLEAYRAERAQLTAERIEAARRSAVQAGKLRHQ